MGANGVFFFEGGWPWKQNAEMAYHVAIIAAWKSGYYSRLFRKFEAEYSWASESWKGRFGIHI